MNILEFRHVVRYYLTAREIGDLESAHRQTSDKRYADRLKTIYLLGKGGPVTQVAEALMTDPETVRNHYKRYRKGGCPRYRSSRWVVVSEPFLNGRSCKTLQPRMEYRNRQILSRNNL